MLSFLHVVNITLPDGSVGNVISLVLCMSPFPTSIQLFLFVCFVCFLSFLLDWAWKPSCIYVLKISVTLVVVYYSFKNSLIIHKPYQMVNKTSRAVVLKPDKTSSLLVCGV